MNKKIFTDDGKLICPQCKKAQDVLAYVPLKNFDLKNTAQVVKCKLCRHVFAPLGYSYGGEFKIGGLISKKNL